MRSFNRFNLIFERVTGALIKDGGNAFTGVSRIKQQDIFSVVGDFKEKILSKFFNTDDEETVFLLGSTGKKSDSGDIDIGVSIVEKEDGVLLTLMKINEACAEADIPSYINPISMNMLHVKYPQPERFCQIDILVTKHPEFAKFFMHSPTPEESRYKRSP